MSSNQDFFGGSVVEAIYCNCYPIVPNRLAYPEHIPKAQRIHHIYNSKGEFYQILKSAISNLEHIRESKYSNFVARYDWSILAPQYDSIFQEMMK